MSAAQVSTAPSAQRHEVVERRAGQAPRVAVKPHHRVVQPAELSQGMTRRGVGGQPLQPGLDQLEQPQPLRRHEGRGDQGGDGHHAQDRAADRRAALNAQQHREPGQGEHHLRRHLDGEVHGAARRGLRQRHAGARQQPRPHEVASDLRDGQERVHRLADPAQKEEARRRAARARRSGCASPARRRRSAADAARSPPARPSPRPRSSPRSPRRRWSPAGRRAAPPPASSPSSADGFTMRPPPRRRRGKALQAGALDAQRHAGGPRKAHRSGAARRAGR